MNGPPQFASPAMPHLGLPTGVQGSPHLSGSAIPSPGQSHLAPPGMGQQGQVQHNVPGAPGPNPAVSPNVSNKRRRASTIKTENDDGNGTTEVNGSAAQGASKVKASPRVGGKRQKGTA